MKWLLQLLEVIVRALLPALMAEATPRREHGRAPRDLRERVRRRVRKARTPVAILALIVLLGGCCARTIYVPDGDPVQLRQAIKNAKIWAFDAQGEAVAGRMDLPEGWYCLPVPEE